MQIRELNLKELYTIYDLVSQLYKEFEDLIYDMRDMNYRMIGIMEKDELISYAGVSVQTTLKDKRHLRVFDLVTDKGYDSLKYDKMMNDYLEDYAKMGMCREIIYNDLSNHK